MPGSTNVYNIVLLGQNNIGFKRRSNETSLLQLGQATLLSAASGQDNSIWIVVSEFNIMRSLNGSSWVQVPGMSVGICRND